jgi:hypothetical protein
MRTKKKTWAPPAFPLRNQLFRDAPGTWRIDQFSQALFPSLKQETAVYRPRLAVFEAYEFARGRAGDAARLAEACAELRPGLLSSNKCLEKDFRASNASEQRTSGFSHNGRVVGL